ncbi:hypothetical protein [Microlunatus sp. GCM10028923]|uniref:hypothetical protein n=1 Tax=Microlunatus sp. GCM10028923 TaxID=3273400 RepID=UPI00360F9CB8
MAPTGGPVPQPDSLAEFVEQMVRGTLDSGFIELHREVLLAGDLWLGTWINPATGRCYLDLITRHRNQHEALRLARLYSHAGGRWIVAICNPLRQQTREVFGTHGP